MLDVDCGTGSLLAALAGMLGHTSIQGIDASEIYATASRFGGDPAMVLAEMRRVVRPGGVVAVAVWNSGGVMPHQRMFWDTAAMLDPEAARLRGRTFARTMTRRHDLSAGFAAVGLEGVVGVRHRHGLER